MGHILHTHTHAAKLVVRLTIELIFRLSLPLIIFNQPMSNWSLIEAHSYSILRYSPYFHCAHNSGQFISYISVHEHNYCEWCDGQQHRTVSSQTCRNISLYFKVASFFIVPPDVVLFSSVHRLWDAWIAASVCASMRVCA